MHSTTQKDEGKNTHTHTQRKKQIIKQKNEKYEIGETTTPSQNKSEDQEKDTLINETLLTRIINIQVV